MSKAEIKNQALRSNNKEFLLDFIEEKPVREYSKEPARAKNIDLDFKKKKGREEVYSHKPKKLISPKKNVDYGELSFLRNSNLSTNEYFTKLIGHINSLKVISGSKLSLDKNSSIQELNSLNLAFEHLSNQLHNIQKNILNGNTSKNYQSEAVMRPGSTRREPSTTTPTRIIREKTQRIDSSPSPITTRRGNFNSSPRSNQANKIKLNIGQQQNNVISRQYRQEDSSQQNPGSKFTQSNERIPSTQIFTFNALPLHQRTFDYSHHAQTNQSHHTSPRILSSSTQHLNQYQSTGAKLHSVQQTSGGDLRSLPFDKKTSALISTPTLQPHNPQGHFTAQMNRLESTSPRNRIRVDGTISSNSRGIISRRTGGTQSYTPRNMGSRTFTSNDSFSNKSALRLKSQTRHT